MPSAAAKACAGKAPMAKVERRKNPVDVLVEIKDEADLERLFFGLCGWMAEKYDRKTSASKPPAKRKGKR